MDLREVGFEAVECGMQPSGSHSAGNFSVNWMTTSYSKITPIHTVSYGFKLYLIKK